MANASLNNDVVLTATIHVEDAAGDMVPAPTGDTFTVTSSDAASLKAVMGTDAAGAPAVVMNALVPTATGITVTVSDSAGLSTYTQMFDIVADTAPTAIMLDLVDATHTAQPVPVSAAPTPPPTPAPPVTPPAGP